MTPLLRALADALRTKPKRKEPPRQEVHMCPACGCWISGDMVVDDGSGKPRRGPFSGIEAAMRRDLDAR
jgi:hypothetical protein